MKRSAFAWSWMAIAGLACTGGQLQPGDGGGSAGAGQLLGVAGAPGNGGDGAGGGAGAGTGATGGGAATSGSGGDVGGAGGAVRITYGVVMPWVQVASPLVVVDNQDTAVVVGPWSSGQNDDPGPRIEWTPRPGFANSTIFTDAVTPSAIAVDPSRNLWLAGQLYRSVSFGGPTLQPVNDGYYLVRLNPDGSHGSSHAVTRAGSTSVYGMAADAQGNVYVVGDIYSGGAPSLIDSVFVTKFSSAGDEIYNREFASQGTSAYATDVAVAPNGDVFIVGTYNSPLQMGTTSLPLPASSLDSIFVAALDPGTGAPRWATRIGGTKFDVGNAIDVTSVGALRVAGTLSGPATVGGLDVQASPDGSPFVAELTPTGGGSWVTLIDGAGIIFQTDTNAADHTFAAGYVNDAQAMMNQTFVADVAGGVATFPLRATVSLDSVGANVVAANRQGDVWVTGAFAGSVDFGPVLLSAGGPDMFANFLLYLEP